MSSPAVRLPIAACVIVAACVAPAGAQDGGFPDLPQPPPIESLLDMPQGPRGSRAAYLGLVTRAAEQAGLPAAVADAVVQVESGYDPEARGDVGEIGLMQVRPTTAAMLGYAGDLAGLFAPETNVRLGVTYLARAWRLAGGDLCRTLMKYRAGWGEEAMTARSVQYCERARRHLAAIGSPLGEGATPVSVASIEPGSNAATAPPRSALGVVDDAYRRELRLAQAQARSRRANRTEADSRRFWAAHEARIRAVKARLRISGL